MSFLSNMAEVVHENEPLSPHTYFGLGGPARWLARPQSVEQLQDILRQCRGESIRYHGLGLGANLLVDDDGVDGVVVRLNGPAFRRMAWEPEADPPRVTAAGGVDLNRLVLDAVRQGFAGLECMAGIPGTLGGAIRMNAGGRFGQIADVVREVVVVDSDGRQHTLPAAEVGFRYRGTNLNDAIVCQATLELRPDDPAELRRRYMEIWDYKKRTQPLGYPSAGCVFRNPPGQSAGQLIDRAGMKGQTVGGAMVALEHANFIVAKEGATARDVLTLIALVRQKVAERFGVELELELEIWSSRRARSEELVAGAADRGF